MNLSDKLAVIEKMKEEMDKCPHLITKRAGDETYYHCRLSEDVSGRMNSCQLEYGGVCEIWEELKEEDGD